VRTSRLRRSGSRSSVTWILASALIATSWVTMMAGLVRDDVLPALERAHIVSRSAGYRKWGRGIRPKATQMGIFFGAERIGQAVTWIKPRESELVIDSRTDLDLSRVTSLQMVTQLFGGSARVVLQFHALVFEGRLVGFHSTISTARDMPPVVSVYGTPLGDRLRLVIRHVGETQTQLVPFDQRQFLQSALTPNMAVSDLRVGKKWIVQTFDPTSGTVRPATAEIVRREKLTLGDA